MVILCSVVPNGVALLRSAEWFALTRGAKWCCSDLGAKW